jgi:hypothetical protein
MSKFFKGMKRPEGAGRKKGNLNYDVASIRQALGSYLAKRLDQDGLDALLADMEPKEVLDTLVKLMPYVMPRMQPTCIPEETIEPTTIKVVLVEPEPYFDDVEMVEKVWDRTTNSWQAMATEKP